MWQGGNWRRGVVGGLVAVVVGLVAAPGSAFAAEGLDRTAVDRFVADFADNAGLEALRERVRLAGGTFQAGPRAHTFEIVATLPHTEAPHPGEP